LALTIPLGLTTGEIQDLLNQAGYALSKSLPNDAVVLYFLENARQNGKKPPLLAEINEVLEGLELPLLMTRMQEEKNRKFAK
jgi:hypothetical protein